MDDITTFIKTTIYDKCALQLTHFELETESTEYTACTFQINGHKVMSRKSKITPKKIGQFVTFWQRDKNHITEPFKDTDDFDFFIINSAASNQLGQFIIPKSELVKHKIISSNSVCGKRGFRVYPSWDIAQNKQAQKTQQLQCDCFVGINQNTDVNTFVDIYK